MQQSSHRESPLKAAVHDYLAALEAGDADRLLALFSANGWVQSPLLGRVSAREFFPKVVAASSATRLSVHDVLVSAEGHPRAVGYFLYEWWLGDGSKVSFECADVFNFNPSTGKIESLIILYDTHPIRALVGDKYA
jgi:ketosteroid isomerase-like protein